MRSYFIVAKTKNGNISLISCKNLTVETKFGNIKCFEKQKKIVVNGNVNIKTTAGDVVLGKVLQFVRRSLSDRSVRIPTKLLYKKQPSSAIFPGIAAAVFPTKAKPRFKFIA